MFHMKQFISQAEYFFVRSVKKKKRLFSVMKNIFCFTPTPVPKLKRRLQLGKEEGVNGYEAFLAREKRSEVDSF